jgi:hypothetical protein
MKTRFKETVRLFFVAFAILFCVTHAQAQKRGKQGPPIPDAKSVVAIVDNLSEELALTKKQKKKVSVLYTHHFDLMREMAADDKKSNSNHKAMVKMRDDFEAEVKSVLKKDQIKKYDDYLKKQHSLGGGKEQKLYESRYSS